MNGVSLQTTQGSRSDSHPSQGIQRKESTQSEKGHESSSDSEAKDDTHNEWTAMVSNDSYCLINVLEVMTHELCKMESYTIALKPARWILFFFLVFTLTKIAAFTVGICNFKLPFISCFSTLRTDKELYIPKSKHKID